jgi:hypothetical protein
MTKRMVAGLVLVGVVAVACERATITTEPMANAPHNNVAAAAASPVGGAGNAVLKQVHAVAARFNSTAQASRAG